MRKWLISLVITIAIVLGGCTSDDVSISTGITENPNVQDINLQDDINLENDKNEQTNEIFTIEKTKSSSQTDSKIDDNQIPVELVRTIDGDTAVFLVDGEEVSARYLLIDTPESKHPNSCEQPFAKEASKRNDELLRSGQISIEFDGPERDKYDRLLVYVFVDGKSVQETLLEEGYARVAYLYDPPYKYLDSFKAAENRAKENRVNIWSLNRYVSNNGFTKCVDGK